MAFKVIFSKYFEIDEKCLDEYGALDLCLDADLPLFIDPFLLFASDKPEYQAIHDDIVGHLIFLKEIAVSGKYDTSLKLFMFPEVKQNWLGMCKYGNEGKGLGRKFALALLEAFNGFYSNFGEEAVTESSHIEKLTLVGSGIGKDFISDFSTNLMLEFLLSYTETFAMEYLQPYQRREFSIRCNFDRDFMIWKPKKFTLPYFYHEKNGDFILLTPLDILTKDDAFICHSEMVRQFRRVTNSIGNVELRNSINYYFSENIPVNPKKKELDEIVKRTITQYPEFVDYYIKFKEQQKDFSKSVSSKKVDQIQNELIKVVSEFCSTVLENSRFFDEKPNSYTEALQRVHYLKNVIENNDGYRVFYHNGKPVASEEAVQRIFRLTWYASPFDVNSEVNNGRGPADYKVSFGSGDSTIVEFKLARSTSLKRNLKNQTEIYKKASLSINDIKVVLCYTQFEIQKVKRFVGSLGFDEIPENIVIIDGSQKQSASLV